MNNNKNERATKFIVCGIILLFMPFINMLGVIFIIIGITMLKNNKDNTIQLNKDDVTQEEIHAHDFTQVEQDDITQQQVHAHDSWNNDGPIKYY